MIRVGQETLFSDKSQPIISSFSLCPVTISWWTSPCVAHSNPPYLDNRQAQGHLLKKRKHSVGTGQLEVILAEDQLDISVEMDIWFHMLHENQSARVLTHTTQRLTPRRVHGFTSSFTVSVTPSICLCSCPRCCWLALALKTSVT